MAEVESSDQHDSNRSKDHSTRSAIMLLCGFCLIVFFLLVPFPIKGRSAIAIGDMAHAPLFGSITLAILLLVRDRRSVMVPIGVVLLVAAAVFLFGIGIELVQSVSGRMATLHDAVSNGLGIVAAVATFLAIQLHKQARMTGFTLSLFALAVMAYASFGPITVLFDVANAKLQFPVLATFDSSAEFGRFYFNRCTPRLVEQNATDGRYAMELTYSSEIKYPGARLHEFESDWTDVKSLELDLVLDQSYPSESCSVMIKVVDWKSWSGIEKDDYFWRTIELSPETPLHVSISRRELIDGPSSRRLNLREIAGIDLIAIEPSETTKIRFDAIRLVLE